MKLAENNIVIERGFDTPLQENTFKIKPSAKAFKILSDGLYTDKIKAIVRELSCNAYDSHVLAGKKDQPFEVQLPTTLEHVFRIRDFGVGLSEEQVFELYTTYFESTKTSSNDFVGALGLGSKSPFSYTESFTVTSWYGGMKKVYTAFINETGFPHIVKVHEEVSTEPNGMEVLVPTKPIDYRFFQAKAAEIYPLFNPIPNIIGRNITVKPVEYSKQTKNFGLRADKVGSARAIVGPVAYPIESTIFVNDRKLQEFIANLALDVFLEIGDVEVAASREALSMTPASIAKVKEKLKDVEDYLKKDLIEKINNAKTLWDAHMEKLDFLSHARGNWSMERVFQQLTSGLTYKGTSLDNRYILTSKLKMEQGPLKRVVSINRYGNSTNVIWDRATLSNVPAYRSGDYGALHFPVQPKTTVVILDKVIPIKMIKAYYTGEHLYYINCVRNGKESQKDFTTRLKKAKLEEFFGGLEAKFTSDLTLPEKDKQVAIKRQEAYVISNSYTSRQYEKKQIDFSKGGIYTEFAGGRPVKTIIRNWPNEYSTLLRLNIIDQTMVVYGISQLDIDEVRKNTKWVLLEDYIKQKLEALLKDKVTEDKLYNNLFQTSYAWKLNHIQDFFNYLADNNSMVKTIADQEVAPLIAHTKKIKSYRADYDIDRLRTVMLNWGIELKFIKDKCDAIAKRFEAFAVRYPLAIDRQKINGPATIEYMNLIYNLRYKV